jgi:hypothetical protein
MPFLDSLDIANRALQHLGGNQIASVTEDSKNNQELSFVYDKVRRAELRRNSWRFAIKKAVLRPLDTTTLLINPDLWSSSATYLPGAIVQDANSLYWISLKPENVNQVPGGNDEYWDMYFGPMTVSLWDTAGKTTYFTGELVYKAGAVVGSYQVFMSLKNGNADTPDVATAWNSTTTYYADQVVSNAGSQWRSLLPFNIGITPADGPANWFSGTTYASGNQVTGSNQRIYTSAVNGNVGNDPTTDSGAHWTDTATYNAWSRSPTLVASATSWLPISATGLRALNTLYPIGAGPSSDIASRNAFHLPAGYLRQAPRDPKAGSTSYLGAPSGLAYTDWEFESQFITTTQSDPMVLRFIADVSVVRRMDDMFCEGLACRMAEATANPLTQSQTQLQTVASEYTKFMGEARLINAIEVGSDEPPEDDYIQCRV